LKNTETESDKNPSPVSLPSTGGLAVPTSSGALSQNTAKLEADLSNEREERCEERFIWIALVFILASGHVYASMENFWAFLVLFLLSLILLIGIAKRLGVDWAVQSVGWFLHWIAERAKFGDK
jgi:hypothetical protein